MFFFKSEPLGSKKKVAPLIRRIDVLKEGNSLNKNRPLLWGFSQSISQLGLTADMPAYLYRKGYAFNQMNFAGLLVGSLRLVYILVFVSGDYTLSTLLLNALPVLGCLLMMVFMYLHFYKTTVLFSFLLFPSLLYIMGWATHDRGLLPYFIPYFIFPFFFLNSKRKILLAFLISAGFFAASFFEGFFYSSPLPVPRNNTLELISLAGSLALTFISLYSIKFQVWLYEKKIKENKQLLRAMNINLNQQKEKLFESNATKDKLFSIISHDLRIPIQGLTLLLTNHGRPGEDLSYLAENLPMVKDELKTTNELLDNLLKWSRLQMSEEKLYFEEIDVQSLFGKVQKSMEGRALAKGIAVDVSFSPVTLRADRSVLEIVLRNLLANAIKFTGKGGAIMITGAQYKDEYKIEVEDNGVGITPESLQRILEKEFYSSLGTCKEKGTGMGLVICRDLMEKCKGGLQIESSTDTGTKVSISFPNANACDYSVKADFPKDFPVKDFPMEESNLSMVI